MPINPREISAPEADQIASRVRLKRAREAAGKYPADLAQFVGNSTSDYYDLENCNGEIYMSLSLGEMSALCSSLGIKACGLFKEGKDTEPSISPEELISKMRTYLTTTGLSMAEFEEHVGCVVEPCLQDSSKVLDWNVDFLRWVCKEIGIVWHKALP